MENTVPQVNNPVVPSIFTPMEIVSVFREQLRTSGKPVMIEGIYTQDEKNFCAGGYFYDAIRGQQDGYQMTIKVPNSLRNEMKNGTLVQLVGTITKEFRQNGFIQIVFIVTRHQVIKENIVSEEEVLLFEALKSKSSLGFKNVDSLLEKILYCGGRPRICLIFARNSITDVDFKKGLESAVSHIDFEMQNVTFTNITEFKRALINADRMDFHALAIVRGGGQGLDIFNNIELVQTLIHLSTPLISAVGHPEEKPFISRIADKDASTPSLLGTYFKELVNRVIEERSKSKAVLVEEVKKQYEERLTVQASQNKSLNEKLTLNAQEMKKLQEYISQMSKAQERATLENERKNKTIEEQLRTINRQNDELKKELKLKNDTETRQAGTIAQQTERISSLEKELSQKKGCMPGCLGMVAAITGIIILIFL